MSMQAIEKAPSEIYFVQVGDKAFFGPYVSLQGADRRLGIVLDHYDGRRSYIPQGWWRDKAPTILKCKVGEPETFFEMHLDLTGGRLK